MSGLNYLGSKISLISLSDIRYVGILHNINPVEATVALQNVKSFGTEGRKANPNEEIPASNAVFDYVVFRGSDIKDLQVFEAPPSFKSESTTRENKTTVTSTTDYSTTNNTYGGSSVYNAPNGTTYQNMATLPSYPQSTYSYPKLNMPVPEPYQPKTETYQLKPEPIVQLPPSSEKKSIIPDKPEAVNEALLDSLVKQVSDLDIKPAEKKPRDRQKKKSDISKKPTQHSKSSPKQTRSTLKDEKAPRRHGRRQSGMVIPKSDFDFASANAKFDKDEIRAVTETTSEAISIPEPDQFYDKKKSFFDDISCESKEYQNGGRSIKFKEESKLNLETFGQSNLPQKRHTRRNRNRGGRGKGKPSTEQEPIKA